MNVKAYLQKTLCQYDIRSIRAYGNTELQQLIDDRIIYLGECYYTRDEDGKRIGLRLNWKLTVNDDGFDTCEVLAKCQA